MLILEMENKLTQKDTETVNEVNDDRETSGITPSNSIDSAAEASQYSRARYIIAIIIIIVMHFLGS